MDGTKLVRPLYVPSGAIPQEAGGHEIVVESRQSTAGGTLVVRQFIAGNLFEQECGRTACRR